MNKICTDILQSKKLVELGIDVNTADIIYNIFGESYIRHGVDIDNTHSPAWSLSALLRLIPTDDKKDEYYVDTESHSDYHTVSYRNCWDGCIHSEYSTESLIDAAFEMVCWLLENKKI